MDSRKLVFIFFPLLIISSLILAISLSKTKSIPQEETPPGCYYQQVQCIQAPCDPILVCPSPEPSIDQKYSCVTDADCTIDTCGCGGINNKFYDPNAPSCDINCGGKEVFCINNRCTVSEKTPIKPDANCKVGGCSGELCLDADSPDVASICIYRGDFACYKSASCEVQPTGECGWTQTPELVSCLQNPPSLN